MTWAERAQHDPALRAFIDAEITRAGIGERAARIEARELRIVIEAQKRKIADLEAEAKSAGKRRAQ